MDIMLEDLNKEYNLRYVKEKLGGVGSVEALEGFMNGFYVSIQEFSKKYRIKINVDKEIDQERLTKLFNRLKTDVYDFKEAKFEKSYIELTVKNAERDIKQAVETAINFLTKEESKSKCAFCGKNESKISYTTLFLFILYMILYSLCASNFAISTFEKLVKRFPLLNLTLMECTPSLIANSCIWPGLDFSAHPLTPNAVMPLDVSIPVISRFLSTVIFAVDPCTAPSE